MRLQGMMLVMAVAALPIAAGAQEREAADDNDRAVHAFLSAVDLGEVQTGLLATRRATSPDVRRFAQGMLGDHSNALHTREMLMQTENSGLVQRMVHTENYQIATMPHSNPAASGAKTASSIDRALQDARPGTPAQAPTEGHMVVEVATEASANGHGANGNGANGHSANGHGANGNGANGNGASERALAPGANGHAGHTVQGAPVDMTLPPGVTLEMVQELEAVLVAHPMSAPVMVSNARNLQVLQGVTGPQFDKLYMDAQISTHRYALENIERLLEHSDALGDDIRGALQQTHTAVAAHLQAAEQIRARLR